MINLPMAGIEKVRPALMTARSWAIQRLRDPRAGDLPWQWYQMMKLCETINALLGDTGGTTREDSQQWVGHREPARRPEDSACRTGNSPLRIVNREEPPPM